MAALPIPNAKFYSSDDNAELAWVQNISVRLPHPIPEYSLFQASYNSYAAHFHHVLREAQITRDFDASASIFAESLRTPNEEASTSIRSYDYALSSDSIIGIKSETDRC